MEFGVARIQQLELGYWPRLPWGARNCASRLQLGMEYSAVGSTKAGLS